MLSHKTSWSRLSKDTFLYLYDTERSTTDQTWLRGFTLENFRRMFTWKTTYQTYPPRSSKEKHANLFHIMQHRLIFISHTKSKYCEDLRNARNLLGSILANRPKKVRTLAWFNAITSQQTDKVRALIPKLASIAKPFYLYIPRVHW